MNEADMKENRDMTLKTPFGVFNLRVGFLTFRAAKALLHTGVDGHWFVPGGRVKFGESSLQAVERELAEEMQAKPLSLDFAGTVENFFTLRGQPYHEIMYLYRAPYPDDMTPPAVDAQGCHITHGWFTAQDLRTLILKPAFLRETLFDFQSGERHVMYREPS